GQEDANGNGVGDACEPVGQNFPCCRPDGSCNELATDAECTAQGGKPGAMGTPCTQANCQPFCDPNEPGVSVLFSALFRAPVCGTGCPTFILGSIMGLMSLRMARRRRRQ